MTDINAMTTAELIAHRIKHVDTLADALASLSDRQKRSPEPIQQTRILKLTDILIGIDTELARRIDVEHFTDPLGPEYKSAADRTNKENHLVWLRIKRDIFDCKIALLEETASEDENGCPLELRIDLNRAAYQLIETEMAKREAAYTEDETKQPCQCENAKRFAAWRAPTFPPRRPTMTPNENAPSALYAD